MRKINEMEVLKMSKKEVDKALIEKLRNGHVYEEKPKETDPTKLNNKDLNKGGGGNNGSKK